jgi:hypothetical protein
VPKYVSSQEKAERKKIAICMVVVAEKSHGNLHDRGTPNQMAFILNVDMEQKENEVAIAAEEHREKCEFQIESERTLKAINMLQKLEEFKVECMGWSIDYYSMCQLLSEDEKKKRSKTLGRQLERGFSCLQDVIKNKIAGSIHEEVEFKMALAVYTGANQGEEQHDDIKQTV